MNQDHKPNSSVITKSYIDGKQWVGDALVVVH